jgi:hypothetical protein
VWDAQHPKPESGPEFERKLLRWLTEDHAKQLVKAAESPESFRDLAGSGVEVVIGRKLDQVGPVTFDIRDRQDRGAYRLLVGTLRNTRHEQELPAVVLEPRAGHEQTVIWTTSIGKAGLFAGSGSLEARPEIKQLLDAGATVIGLDLLYQGEFLTNSTALSQTKRVKNSREAAAYTFGYNRAVFAERVHDVLTALAFAKNEWKKPVSLAGLDSTGPLIAAARAIARDAVKAAALNTGGFRFGRVLAIHDPEFLPGGANYGDLPGMLALHAPGPLWVAGEGNQAPTLTAQIYAKTGAEKNLTVAGPSATGPHLGNSAAAWLVQAWQSAK